MKTKINLDMPIDHLFFGSTRTARVHNVADYMDIKTVRDLIGTKEEDLRTRISGTRTIESVKDFLFDFGLSLGMTENEIMAYEGISETDLDPFKDKRLELFMFIFKHEHNVLEPMPDILKRSLLLTKSIEDEYNEFFKTRGRINDSGEQI